MNFARFSFSRLLTAGLFISLLSFIVTGCDKNDKQAPPPPSIPVVTTAALTNVTTNGATGGGSIVSDGGAAVTASGIVWSKTNATPTLEDSVIASTTVSGTFTSEITGLEDNASYYVRAFATNSVGTGYGEVVTLNTISDSNKVRFTYNGEDVVYGVVVSATTGKRWLDRNLGAKQVADSATDFNAYGDLFQWGRPSDGHQLIYWTSSTAGTPVNGVTETLATTDAPGHNNFITPPVVDPFVLDWRDDNNGNRWAAVPQGPCPEGWHVPTHDEWMAEVFNDGGNGGTASSGGMTNSGTAYDLLKLTVAGYRGANSSGVVNAPGDLSSWVGVRGFYWSSTNITGSFNVSDGLNSDQGFARVINNTKKAQGFSVRCIRD